MKTRPEKGSEESRPHAPRLWGWALGLALFIALVSSGPMLAGYLHTPEGRVYLGCGECVSDQVTYYAKMWPGYRGEWLSLNRYSSEPHPPVLWYPFYVRLGQLARVFRRGWYAITGSDLPVEVIFPVTYHVVRFVLVVVLFLSIYGLTGGVFRRPAHRFWTMGLAAFAGGLSPTVGIVEAHTLQACFFMPHFVLGQLLYVWTLWGFLLATRRPASRWAPLVLCGVGGWGLGWVHPFDLVPLLAIGVLFLATVWYVRKRFPVRLFVSGCLFVLGASIPVLYMQFVLMRIPMFAWMSRNNVLFWESRWQCFEMLDVYLIGALVLGVWALWRRCHRVRFLFVWVWILVGTLALFVPSHFQRRFIEGLPIGLAFAWTLGLERCGVLPLMRRIRRRLREDRLHSSVWYRNRLRHGLFILAFALLLPRTVCVYSWECYIACFPVCYEPMSRIRACEWLTRNTDWQEVVWATGEVANRIPFLVGNRVFAGHWNETMDYPEKGEWTDKLQRLNLDVVEFRRIVRAYGVRYLFWTDDPYMPEKDIRKYDPETLGEPVYESGEFHLFALKPPHETAN